MDDSRELGFLLTVWRGESVDEALDLSLSCVGSLDLIRPRYSSEEITGYSSSRCKHSIKKWRTGTTKHCNK